MGEFEEVDLSKKYNIITNNDKFKLELSKWLFNLDYNYLGNVLSHIDIFDNNINIYKEDNFDLQFNCRNVNNEEYTIYLFDDDKNLTNSKYMLVFKKNADIEYFCIHYYRNILSISSGLFIYDDDYVESSSKQKEKVRII